MSLESSTSLELATYADIDQTLLQGYIIFPLMQTLAEDRVISPQQNQAFQYALERFESGAIDYGAFVIETMSAFCHAIRDKRDADIKDALDEHIKEIVFYPWVLPTFDDARSMGTLTIVTAEPGVIARAVADLFDAEYMASEFPKDANGRYTGGPFTALGSAQKQQKVAASIDLVQPTHIAVFGDSIGDAGMLELAQPLNLAHCITPDAELRAIAEKTGMTIIEDPFVSASLLRIKDRA